LTTRILNECLIGQTFTLYLKLVFYNYLDTNYVKFYKRLYLKSGLLHDLFASQADTGRD